MIRVSAPYRLVADKVGSIDTLVGTRRPTAASGTVEDWFGKLLEDRPHIVWRALLDTEVFGVQDAQTCLDRLSLAATYRNDLPFIYQRLRGLGAPRKIHVDGSEIVTGTLPLPALDDGLVLAAGAGRAVGGTAPRPVASLDWTKALALGSTKQIRRPAPSWSRRPPRAEPASTAHVAVVAACEGEAVLVTGWLDAHLSELETMLGLGVASISWTASDIAPVGHFAEGTLQLRGIEAQIWVLAGTSVRLHSDEVAGLIARAVSASGRPLVRVVLDETDNNVGVVSPRGDDDPEARSFEDEVVAVDPGAIGTRTGGLHKSTLVEVLTGRGGPDG